MDRIEIEKSYPQNVKVVNELNAKVESSETDPLIVLLPSAFVGGSGSSSFLRVNDTNNQSGCIYVKPSGSAVNGFISCVHVVNSGVGYIFPINQDIFNVSSSSTFETVIIPSLHSSFEQKFPSATSIIVFYSYQNANRLYTFGSYSGQS